MRNLGFIDYIKKGIESIENSELPTGKVFWLAGPLGYGRFYTQEEFDELEAKIF